MPRIPDAQKATREKFVKDFFRGDPDASGAKVNKELKGKFGQEMRMPLVYKFREEIRQEMRAGYKPQVGHRPSGPAQAQGVALVPGSKDQLEFLRGAIEQLNAAGVASLKVDHQTDKYVVVSQT